MVSSSIKSRNVNVYLPGRVAQSNVSGYRCLSDCRSRGREFDPGPVPYFRGDWSWNNFYGHSPPLRWIIQEGLLSVTSESMCIELGSLIKKQNDKFSEYDAKIEDIQSSLDTKYWLTACSKLAQESVVRWTDRPAMTIAVDLGGKATKQNKKVVLYLWYAMVW